MPRCQWAPLDLSRALLNDRSAGPVEPSLPACPRLTNVSHHDCACPERAFVHGLAVVSFGSSSSVRSCAVCSFPHRQTVCPPWHRSMPCVFGVLAVGYVLLPYVGYALSVLLMILTIFCLRWGCALSFLWSTCCAWHALSRSSRGLHSFLHALFVESSCLCLFSNCTCRFPGSRFRTLWPTLLWLCVGGSLRLLVRQRLCLSELSGRKSFKALSALAWPAVKAFFPFGLLSSSMISFSVATSQLHESFSLDLPASVWSHRLRRVRDAAFHVHSSPPRS